MGGRGSARSRHPVVSFGSAEPLSVGVEEEFFIVQGDTLDTAPLYSSLTPEPESSLKAELFECLVETTTPICANACDLLRELQRLRTDLAQRAEELGTSIVAIGTHPFARGEGQPIVPVPRYRRMAKQLGDAIYRQLVCGLHVHVAMPDPETCVRTFEAVVPWLPVLLGLSANSPFAEGRPTGLRSSRAERLLELPSGGTPPILCDWGDWERAAGDDEARRHWDAWPRPGYGTLEVRVMDQQTDLHRSAGFAALIRALCVAATADAPYDRERYARERARAAREWVDPLALRALVEPASRELGEWPLVEQLFAARPEAERQLELGPHEALRDAVERSVVFDS
jgi:carboxylate-amine ligase